KVVGSATSPTEARRWQAENRCYGILVIPEDSDRDSGRGEQTHVDFYSDMSLLLRFRTFLSALTDVQLATGAKIRTQKMEAAGLPASEAPISSEAFFLGDSEQGFASFIIPGIVVLIIQQSMILGIAMLVGTSRERRRRNGGIDPLEIQATPSATMAGKLLAYLVPYLPMAIYALHYVPLIFSLPHSGSMTQYLPFFLPMLIASAGFGLVISQIFIKEREMSLMVVVFTSVGFLFLSGLTWPRYAMHPLWQWIGNCIPAVWGVEGFIRINSNGATLAQNSHPYLMLWLLSAIYWSIYWVMLRHKRKKLF
ncbi:MAG: ABC transporter permease, partial [Muribaculaceae bacterium]|nr:ABC transporter permease [Muribaculaceae bacterium]